jgi:hypothetical protein
LGYAVRTLRLNPGLATVAIVTLARGIGGTTAVFSVLDPVPLRPLPYAEPERLVSIATYLPWLPPYDGMGISWAGVVTQAAKGSHL